MSKRTDPLTYSVCVARTYSAAHRLASPELSDDENDRIYGKCAHPGGHGHDYRFEFVVSADALTDHVVIARDWLAKCIDGLVKPQFDCVNLNETVGQNEVTSGENLVRKAWELLAPQLPSHTSLRVHLHETRKNSFCYPPD
ncbi:MAG: hypothetical protein GF341_06415 [candidate division Zixibacteria bacterium]|nr:hypothetical protein [candidate division Zixibacteria bacterium]